MDPHDPANYPIDFGSGVRGKFYGWAPDRQLNPQFADLPDIERLGLMLIHEHDGATHVDSIMFDIPGADHFHGARWQLVSMDPLHVEPSILDRECGWHGYIRDGRWVAA